MLSSPQLLTLLTVVATGRLVDGVFKCPIDEGFACSSCTTLAYCSGGKPFLEHQCESDQLCVGDPQRCTPNNLIDPKVRDCRCGMDYPSFEEDPYDDQKFLICLPGPLHVPGSCPDGQVFDETDPPCAVQQPLECPEIGVFPVLPGCGGHYACLPDASGVLTPTDVFECGENQVFDPEKLECVENIEPATVTCTDGQVAVADTVECNAFHICDGAGEPVRGPFCCPNEGHVFNGDTLKCEPDTGAVSCPTPNPCPGRDTERFCLPPMTATPTTDSTTTIESTTTTSESTTTTTESTTTTPESTTTPSSTTTTTSASIPDCRSSGTGAYPIPGDCKRYYYCYKWKLYIMTCSGQLVFNPNNNTCDLPSNYPQCA